MNITFHIVRNIGLNHIIIVAVSVLFWNDKKNPFLKFYKTFDEDIRYIELISQTLQGTTPLAVFVALACELWMNMVKFGANTITIGMNRDSTI
jgi:hypothetical protein